jgi:hypothetical protein
VTLQIQFRFYTCDDFSQITVIIVRNFCPLLYLNGEVAHRVLLRHLRERDHLKDVGVDGRVILKLIFDKGDGEAWTGLIWLRIGTGRELL